jgi:hypothetical protein
LNLIRVMPAKGQDIFPWQRRSPQGTQKIGRKIIKRPQGLTIAAVIWLVIGAVLCLFGYFR